jgi:hypothetical protein
MTFMDTTVPDFWRISRDGMATIIRPYREDRAKIVHGSKILTPGTWFYVYVLVRELAELLRHARALAKIFPEIQMVAIRATWHGLKDRRIDNPTGELEAENRVSHTDARTAQGEWPIADLAATWPEIVTYLANHITRLFAGLEITPEWVRHVSKRFNKL